VFLWRNLELQTSNLELFTIPDVEAISETKPTDSKILFSMRNVYLFTLLTFIFYFEVAAQDKFITLGSGGGFTGSTTIYKVTPAGKVFKGVGIGDVPFTHCGKIEKAKAKQMMTSVADQVSAAASFNHPGNLFYFISYTENNNVKSIKWGDADHPIQEDVKKLYDEMLASVNGISFKPIK